jgi:hypothetical protein
MSEELKCDPVLPPPRVTEAEKQALLEPWLERRRAQFTAECSGITTAASQGGDDPDFDVIEWWEASDAWGQGWNNSRAARKST